MSAPKRRLILSRRARTDVRDIEAYTLEHWGEQQWAIYEEALAQAFATVEEHPNIGRQRPELGVGIRTFVVREHVIYYQISNTAIHVLRIRHGRSDPRRALRGRP
jgi:toxin ParE1/3/4